MNNARDEPRILFGVGVAATVLSGLWFAGTFANASLPAKGPSKAGPPSARPAPTPTALEKQYADLLTPQNYQKVPPQEAELLNLNVPFSTLPNPAAEPFVLPTADPAAEAAARTCLTMAVYYEAGNQGPDGEAAVAQVVLNRLRNPLFPKTVCGVVFQGSTLPTGCQFTFTCDGSLSRRPRPAGWRFASAVAERALNGGVEKSVGYATHFHTIWVVPYWRASVVKLTQIGVHIFYRMDGPLGLPGAFRERYAGVEPGLSAITGFETELPAQPDPATLAASVAPIVRGTANSAPLSARPVEVALVRSAPPPATLANANLDLGLEPPPAQNPHLAMPSKW